MKPTYFNNKKSLNIVSPEIKNDIKSIINNIGSFNLTSKYYTFLNKQNVNNLKENNFLVSLSSFGKKFILFVTKYNSKKYCIFINKKNDSMIVTQLKFMDEIFMGTLFDGELVKNSNDKWIYLINDIAYYKGTNIITKTFTERDEIIKYILKNEHDNNDEINQPFYISKKEYFDYKYIKDLVNNYMNYLNYKCAGLYFKNVNNFSDNYLFIFPECRTDSKILNNGTTVDNQKINLNNDSDKEEDKNFKVKTNNSIKLERTTCRFLINGTAMPDIYELYTRNNNNNIEKYSYASVPDMETSDFLKKITENNNNNEDINTKINKNNAIYVECNYHKGFKKWIPYKKVDSMDNTNIVNQTQIILDSL